jgi:tetratricopeptide (TPR) repeat protein
MKKNKENDLFQQALELHKKGEGNKAQIKYEEILEINPLNYDALERFCQYGVENNDWAKVKDILSKAINLDYSNPFIYNNLGNILLELNQFK